MTAREWALLLKLEGEQARRTEVVILEPAGRVAIRTLDGAGRLVELRHVEPPGKVLHHRPPIGQGAGRNAPTRTSSAAGRAAIGDDRSSRWLG